MNVVNVKNTAEPITPVEKIGGCNTAGELLAALGGGLLRTTAGVRILGDYSLESIQDLDWTPPASGIRPDQLCFSYQGKRLEDDGRTLTEYGIKRGSVLRVVLRLRGGGGGRDGGGGRGVQPLATTLALTGWRPGPLRPLSRGAASAGRLLLLRAGDVERNPGMATVDTAYVKRRLKEARAELGADNYGRMATMFNPPPDWATWSDLAEMCDTNAEAANFFLTKWPPPVLESSNLTDRGHLGQPLPKPGADWPQSESLNTGGRAFEYAPTTVTCWESVADVPLDAKITQFRDRVDDVERRWLPTGVLATPINSEAAVSGAVQMLVGEACTLILQKHQQQQIFAAPAAVWETQPRSDIIQAAVAYAAQQRSVQPTSSSNALAHFFAPSAGATASSGIKRKVDMALMVAEPATPAAQQSTERGGGLSPAGEEAGPSDAAPTPDRPKKRRCICVGELKRASKLMIRLDQPVDLVAAWNDAKHKYHMQAKAVVRQQYTYMMLWQLCYGFISCYFGTWLVYCPPNPPEARRGLFVSRAYLATDGSPKVTALAAVAWIHQQAVCSMQELVAAHPDPPLLATDCDEAAADDDGLPDAGARTDSASAYSPSSQALREADESGGSSNAGQGSALLKLPACAPSNRLRLYSELCRGSEGLVMRGLYGGVDAVVKLLGPDSAGLAAFTREAAVLAAFAPLAGQAAPRLLGAGHIRAGVHFIATAYMAGQPLSSLQHVPRHVAAAVQHAYGRLRSLQPRFLHGDVHSRNILLLNGASGSDTCLTCIFLDFGRSRLDASAAEQQAEKRKLQSLLAD